MTVSIARSVVVVYLALQPLACFGASVKKANQALASRNFARARTLYETQMQTSSASPEDAQTSGQGKTILGFDPIEWIKFARALCSEGLLETEVALDQYRSFIEQNPRSDLVGRATYGVIRCLTSLGRISETLPLYEDRMAILLAGSRQRGLAGRYLELAQMIAQGSPRPNPGKAADILGKTGPLGLNETLRTEIELVRARYLEAVNPEKAIQSLETILSTVRPAPSVDSHILEQTRLDLARALAIAGKHVRSRQALFELVEAYPASPHVPEALRMIATSYGFPRPETRRDLVKGAAALEHFLDRFPTDPRAALVRRDLAMAYLDQEITARALRILEPVLRSAQAPPQIPADRLLELARSLKKHGLYGPARRAYSLFLLRTPDHDISLQARLEFNEISLDEADGLFAKKRFDEARELYLNFLNAHPEDHRRARIDLQLSQILVEKGQIEEALHSFEAVKKRYKSSEEATQAQRAIGDIYERFRQSPNLARAAYRELLDSPLEEIGRAGLTRLDATSIELDSLEVASTGTPVRLTVSCRNLEDFRLRLNPLNPLRAFLDGRGIPDPRAIDIDLIPPARVIPVHLDSRPGSQVTTSVDLGTFEPGYHIAIVQGELDSDRVGILISDLDLIVKSSKKSALVFASNRRTGKPIDGAKVMVSDGTEVFAAGTTDSNGWLEITTELMKGTDALHILVTSGPHAAWARISLPDARVSDEALQIETILDRPCYAPGDTIRFCAVLRQAMQNHTNIPSIKRLNVDLIDAEGLTATSSDGTVSPEGVMRTLIKLPPDIKPGRYETQLISEDLEQPYQAVRSPVIIRKWTYHPIKIRFVPDRAAIVPGIPISGSIDVRYPDGSPAAGVELELTLRDDSGNHEDQDTYITNDEGQIRYRFASSGIVSHQPTLEAHSRQHGVRATRQFQVMGSDLMMNIEPDRTYCLSGEPVRVKIAVQNTEKKPRGGTFDVFLERSLSREEPTPRIMDHHEVIEIQETGVTTITVTPTIIGDYQIRISGRDEEGNAENIAKNLQVTSPEDPVFMRILPPQTEPVSGLEVDFPITHWGPPVYALAILEDGVILDKQLVALRTGINQVTWRIPQRNSNFWIGFVGPDGVVEANRRVRAQEGLRITMDLPEVIDCSPPSFPATIRLLDANNEPVQGTVDLSLYRTEGDGVSGPSQQGDGMLRKRRFRNHDAGEPMATQLSRNLSNRQESRESETRPGAGSRDSDLEPQSNLQPDEVDVPEFRSTQSVYIGNTTTTDAEGRVRFELPFPENTLQADIRVWALTTQGEVIEATRKVQFQSPLHVELSGPGSVIRGDHASAQIVITNHTDELIEPNLIVLVRTGATPSEANQTDLAPRTAINEAHNGKVEVKPNSTQCVYVNFDAPDVDDLTIEARLEYSLAHGAVASDEATTSPRVIQKTTNVVVLPTDRAVTDTDPAAGPDAHDDSVTRTIQLSPPLLQGREIKPGSTILRTGTRVHPEDVENIRVGEPIDVQIQFDPETSTICTLEEYVPGGVAILEETIKGNFESVNLDKGRIKATFRLRSGGKGFIGFRCIGLCPGRYQHAPTRVSCTLNGKTRILESRSGHLEILQRKETPSSQAKLSPDESWARGLGAFERGNVSAARQFLNPLKSLNLIPKVRRRLLDLDLKLALQARNEAEVVKDFIALQGQFPDHRLESSTLVEVARILGKSGETARAVDLYDRLLNARFLTESQIANEYWNIGDISRSIDYTQHLLDDYPDSTLTASTHLALGKIRDSAPTREVDRLESYSLLRPEKHLSRDYFLAMGLSLLEDGRVAECLTLTKSALEQEGSAYTDCFKYMEGLLYYRINEIKGARAALQSVTEASFDSKGRPRVSDYRPYALYILAKIHHAEGQIQKALGEYRKVTSWFSDAAACVREFQEAWIEMDPLVEILPGHPAQINVRSRNVDSLTIRAHKIDLEELLRSHRLEEPLRKINLSGIDPLFEMEVYAANRKPGTDTQTRSVLPLSGEGVYLITAESRGVSTKTILLISGLRLRTRIVQGSTNTDVRGWRVDVRSSLGQSVPEADVILVVRDKKGTRQILRGRTDSRGMFEIHETPDVESILVRFGDSLAFENFIRTTRATTVIHLDNPVKIVDLEAPLKELQQNLDAEGRRYLKNHVFGLNLNGIPVSKGY